MSPWRTLNKNTSFTIKRWHKHQLEDAIDELESRGFEVIGRVEHEVVANNWDYQYNKSAGGNKYNVNSTDGGRLYYARVRKKPIELADSTGT